MYLLTPPFSLVCTCSYASIERYIWVIVLELWIHHDYIYSHSLSPWYMPVVQRDRMLYLGPALVIQVTMLLDCNETRVL